MSNLGPFGMRLIGAAMLAAAAVGPMAAPALAFDVVTHHYDQHRSGWNDRETTLTPASVAGRTFGLLASVAVDQQIDAQPLLMTGLLLSGQTAKRDVLFVATERNTVYALDADTGAILLKRNLGVPAGAATTGNCTNNSSSIGIGSTPVIDAGAKTMYLITDTLDKGAPVFRLHALKLTDLSDAIPSVVIDPTHRLSNGAIYRFNPDVTRQRSALLLLGSRVYAGFASYCDLNGDESRGWLLGWNAATLVPLAASQFPNNRASSAIDFFLTSIWMSGAGPAADVAGDLWFVTGNSDPQGPSYAKSATMVNLTESAIRATPDLSRMVATFTPFDWDSLDQADDDFGAGGIMVLPAQSGTPIRMAVAAGKDGNLYLMNIAAPGGLTRNGPNHVLDTEAIGGCWCAESYFTGSDAVNRVVSSGGNAVRTWRVVTTPAPHLVPDSWSATLPHNGQDGGFFTTVTSNGNNDGIIWAVGRPDGSNGNAVYLDAIDAKTGKFLVSDAIAGYWPNNQANANIVPVAANGKVYVASFRQVTIWGLGASGTAHPLAKLAISPATASGPPATLHTLYGTIRKFTGTTILLETRDGKTVTVDASEAIKEHRLAPAASKLAILGHYDRAGVLHAVSISRAKNDSAGWAPDR